MAAAAIILSVGWLMVTLCLLRALNTIAALTKNTRSRELEQLTERIGAVYEGALQAEAKDAANRAVRLRSVDDLQSTQECLGEWR
jgi:hypothetical protein